MVRAASRIGGVDWDMAIVTCVLPLLLIFSLPALATSGEHGQSLYDLSMQRGKAYLITHKDYPSAAECFRRAIEEKPSSWEPYFLLGKTYESIGVMDHAWYYSNTAYNLAKRQVAKDSVVSWIARAGLYLVGAPPDSIRQYDAWCTAWPDSVLDRRMPPIAGQSVSDLLRLRASSGTQMVKHGEAADTVSSLAPNPPRPREWYEFSSPLPSIDLSEVIKYPALAEEENIEGLVTMIAITDQNGRVVQAWAQEPAAAILIDAGLEAIYRIRFSTHRGRPTPRPRERILIPIRFPP
jgi:hypothetical protein